MDDKAERAKLLTYFANSYSAYFKSDEIGQEISKLEEYIEETVVKLEELQSLFEMNENENKEWREKIVPAILEQNKAAFQIFNKRLEALSKLMHSLKETLDTLETQIAQAEQAFGLTSSFRNVLNYFRRPVEPAVMLHTLESAKFVPLPDIDIDSKFFEAAP